LINRRFDDRASSPASGGMLNGLKKSGKEFSVPAA
jgi:hypothetical protein